MKSVNFENVNPLVSVVIPVYNGEKYITECLESVYQQTYPFFEVIVIDDGSTDQSLEIINKIPGDKKVISQQNKDVCHARNMGIKNASGELIAFLDQDDFWLPEKLEKQVQKFVTNPDIDLVFTNIIKQYSSGKRHHAEDKHRIALSLTDENLFSKLVIKNVLAPSSVMLKKESIVRLGLFDEAFKTCGDHEMWLRMAKNKLKFRYIPEVLTIYRQHEENTSKKTEVMHKDRIIAIKKIFQIDNLDENMKEMESPALASAYLFSAHTFFSIKQYDRFLKYAKLAISHDKSVLSWKYLTRFIRSWIFAKILRSGVKQSSG